MKPTEILTGVRELLSDETHWTKYVMAARKDGSLTAPFADDATCWCLVGAFYKVCPPKHSGLNPDERDTNQDLLSAQDILRTVLAKEAGTGILTFNDRVQTTHADVMTMLDKAIVQAKERGHFGNE
jgi:hypothetical protein